jgi:hypothetical protein
MKHENMKHHEFRRRIFSLTIQEAKIKITPERKKRREKLRTRYCPFKFIRFSIFDLLSMNSLSAKGGPAVPNPQKYWWKSLKIEKSLSHN